MMDDLSSRAVGWVQFSCACA